MEAIKEVLKKHFQQKYKKLQYVKAAAIVGEHYYTFMDAAIEEKILLGYRDAIIDVLEEMEPGSGEKTVRAWRMEVNKEAAEIDNKREKQI